MSRLRFDKIEIDNMRSSEIKWTETSHYQSSKSSVGLGLPSAVSETMVKITNLFLIDFCFIEQMVLQSLRLLGESNFSYKSFETTFYTTLTCKIENLLFIIFLQIQISNCFPMFIFLLFLYKNLIFYLLRSRIWFDCFFKVETWLVAWWR